MSTRTRSARQTRAGSVEAASSTAADSNFLGNSNDSAPAPETIAPAPVAVAAAPAGRTSTRGSMRRAMSDPIASTAQTTASSIALLEAATQHASVPASSSTAAFEEEASTSSRRSALRIKRSFQNIETDSVSSEPPAESQGTASSSSSSTIAPKPARGRYGASVGLSRVTTYPSASFRSGSAPVFGSSSGSGFDDPALFSARLSQSTGKLSGNRYNGNASPSSSRSPSPTPSAQISRAASPVHPSSSSSRQAIAMPQSLSKSASSSSSSSSAELDASTAPMSLPGPRPVKSTRQGLRLFSSSSTLSTMIEHESEEVDESIDVQNNASNRPTEALNVFQANSTSSSTSYSSSSNNNGAPNHHADNGIEVDEEDTADDDASASFPHEPHPLNASRFPMKSELLVKIENEIEAVRSGTHALYLLKVQQLQSDHQARLVEAEREKQSRIRNAELLHDAEVQQLNDQLESDRMESMELLLDELRKKKKHVDVYGALPSNGASAELNPNSISTRAKRIKQVANEDKLAKAKKTLPSVRSNKMALPTVEIKSDLAHIRSQIQSLIPTMLPSTSSSSFSSALTSDPSSLSSSSSSSSSSYSVYSLPSSNGKPAAVSTASAINGPARGVKATFHDIRVERGVLYYFSREVHRGDVLIVQDEKNETEACTVASVSSTEVICKRNTEDSADLRLWISHLRSGKYAIIDVVSSPDLY